MTEHYSSLTTGQQAEQFTILTEQMWNAEDLLAAIKVARAQLLNEMMPQPREA
jgi:hypothetical protein